MENILKKYLENVSKEQLKKDWGEIEEGINDIQADILALIEGFKLANSAIVFDYIRKRIYDDKDNIRSNYRFCLNHNLGAEATALEYKIAALESVMDILNEAEWRYCINVEEEKIEE